MKKYQNNFYLFIIHVLIQKGAQPSTGWRLALGHYSQQRRQVQMTFYRSSLDGIRWLSERRWLRLSSSFLPQDRCLRHGSGFSSCSSPKDKMLSSQTTLGLSAYVLLYTRFVQRLWLRDWNLFSLDWSVLSREPLLELVVSRIIYWLHKNFGMILSEL